jgi:hypothetical protein
MTKIVNEETGWGKLQFAESDGARKLHLSIETITTILRLGNIAKALAKWNEKKGREPAKKTCYLVANQLWAIALLARKQEKNVRFYAYRVAEAMAFTAEEPKHASAVAHCGGQSLTIPVLVLSEDGRTHLLLHNDGVETRPNQRKSLEFDDDMKETYRALLLAMSLIADTKDSGLFADINRCLKLDPHIMSLI